VLDRVRSSELQNRFTVAKSRASQNTGGAFVRTHLRKGKKHCAIAEREKRENYVRETTLQTPRSEQ